MVDGGCFLCFSRSRLGVDQHRKSQFQQGHWRPELQKIGGVLKLPKNLGGVVMNSGFQKWILVFKFQNQISFWIFIVYLSLGLVLHFYYINYRVISTCGYKYIIIIHDILVRLNLKLTIFFLVHHRTLLYLIFITTINKTKASHRVAAPQICAKIELNSLEFRQTSYELMASAVGSAYDEKSSWWGFKCGF